jgi:hypothetical protein
MERKLDAKGRWRNRTVGFRVSDEEWKLITEIIQLSGLPKQEYIMKKLTDREIIVKGNPKVYIALKNQMENILEELRRLEKVSDENEELLITIQQVAKTLNGMKGDELNGE